MKCGISKSIIDTHLERYPDIPVFVNEELAVHYQDNPNVYSGGITRDAIEDVTKSTLAHASDLLDLEIPWISAGVSSFYNVKRMVTEHLPLQLAARNVVIDTTSRASLAAAGQGAFTFAASALFVSGGAFVIVLPLVGAYVGLKQSWHVTNQLKKVLAKYEYQELEKSLADLVTVLKRQLHVKKMIKEEKWEDIHQKSANSEPLDNLEGIHQERLQFVGNMEKELGSIEQEITKDSVRAFERLIAVLMKSGIHVHAIRRELGRVEKAMKELQRKL